MPEVYALEQSSGEFSENHLDYLWKNHVDYLWQNHLASSLKNVLKHTLPNLATILCFHSLQLWAQLVPVTVERSLAFLRLFIITICYNLGQKGPQEM